DGIRDPLVTGVQTCALPIWRAVFVSAAGARSLGRDLRLRELLPDHLRRLDDGDALLDAFLDRSRLESAVRVRPELVRGHVPKAQIGRASCRERGESGVAVEG